MAAGERSVQEEEEAVARGAHQVLLDREGDTPSTGTLAVREQGQGGGTGGGAEEGEVAPGGGAGSWGSGGGTAASQPQPGADADGLELGVAIADSVFSGWVFLEALKQERHAGKSMSYFYPLKVSLYKAQRNLVRRRVIHMGLCPHLQVHFSR